MHIDFGSTEPTDPITIVSFSKKDERTAAATLLKSKGFPVCYFDDKDLTGKKVYYILLEFPEEYCTILTDLAHTLMRGKLKLNTASTTWYRQAWDEQMKKYPAEIKPW